MAKKLNVLTPYELNSDRKLTIVRDLFPQINEVWMYNNTDTEVETFTTRELEAAAANIKTGKAPGLDKIPPEAIKLVAEDLPDWLLGVRNGMLENQIFPDGASDPNLKEWQGSGVLRLLQTAMHALYNEQTLPNPNQK